LCPEQAEASTTASRGISRRATITRPHDGAYSLGL
jgi:hypothetical protein